MMKKYMTGLGVVCTLFLSGCGEDKNKDTLKFAVSAEYPPFEYYDHGEIKGFDIDLARMIAHELGKKAVFEDRQFSTLLPAVAAGQVDAAISTITITEDRRKNFDLSHAYYAETLATVFPAGAPLTSKEQMVGKKIVSQLGTAMEIWLKKNMPTAQLTLVDSNNQCIESLKAGYVEAAFMDGPQAAIFSEKNPGLSYAVVAKSDDGYGVALKKGSPLTAQVNQAIKKLEAKGEIKKLVDKWLKGVPQ